MTAKFDHCGLPTCAEVREADGRCYCSCEVCSTCACGCMARGGGFDQVARGVYVGRGAGYHLIFHPGSGWDIVTGDAEPVLTPGTHASTLDVANLLATKHAREAGHVHP